MDYVIVALLILSWLFIIFGMVAIFKLKNLYTRILSAATIDTVASLTILIALMLSHITEYEYVLRFLMLIGFLIITSPISSHVNIRSAFLSGVEIRRIEPSGTEERKQKEKDDLYA